MTRISPDLDANGVITPTELQIHGGLPGSQAQVEGAIARDPNGDVMENHLDALRASIGIARNLLDHSKPGTNFVSLMSPKCQGNFADRALALRARALGVDARNRAAHLFNAIPSQTEPDAENADTLPQGIARVDAGARGLIEDADNLLSEIDQQATRHACPLSLDEFRAMLERNGFRFWENDLQRVPAQDVTQATDLLYEHLMEKNDVWRAERVLYSGVGATHARIVQFIEVANRHPAFSAELLADPTSLRGMLLSAFETSEPNEPEDGAGSDMAVIGPLIYQLIIKHAPTLGAAATAIANSSLTVPMEELQKLRDQWPNGADWDELTDANWRFLLSAWDENERIDASNSFAWNENELMHFQRRLRRE